MELTQILGKFEGVEETRDGYLALCPTHNDTNPSLVISVKPDGTVLMKCRAGCSNGDILKAVDLSFADLFDVRGEATFTAKPDAKVSPADRAALATYLDKVTSGAEPAMKYAAERFGITEDRFRELGLGYDDGTVTSRLKLSKGTYHDAPRLVVPFCDFEGSPVYLQARAISGGYSGSAKWSGPLNPEGASWGKFGYFSGGTGWDEVIITEGPGDALSVVAVGYDAVAIRGAGLGSNSSVITELSAGLEGRRIIVAGDSDQAGERFTQAVASALSEKGLNVHKLIIPAADLTDWRSQVTDFASVLKAAVARAPKYGKDEVLADVLDQEIVTLFTDVENARALLAAIRRDGSDVKFTPEAGYLVYTPSVGVWQPDSNEFVRRQAQDVGPIIQARVRDRINEIERRTFGLGDTAIRDKLLNQIEAARRRARGPFVRYTMSRQGIDGMIRELQALYGIYGTITDFDLHSRLLAVGNGVVDLETGELMPYSSETKELNLLKKIEVEYDPAARNPRWEQFLTEIFPGEPELPDYLRRLVGYGITGYTSEQCFAVLWGSGANGKSVLTDVLSEVFKSITVTTPFSTFEARKGGIPNDIAALKGARLVMASEGAQNAPMDEATIKRLTGQDEVTARFMRQEFFTFKPSFLILLGTNYKPNFRGQDEGLWRRVKLIPFTRFFKPSERDNYLAQKFVEAEIPRNAYKAGEDFGDGVKGILAWAIRGAMEYFAEGLKDPKVVTQATEDYKVGADALNGFIGDVIIPDPDGRMTGKEVWELYQTWTEDEGMPLRDRWRRATLWGALEERGAVKTVHARTVGFRGFRKLTPGQKGATLEAPFDAK